MLFFFVIALPYPSFLHRQKRVPLPLIRVCNGKAALSATFFVTE